MIPFIIFLFSVKTVNAVEENWKPYITSDTNAVFELIALSDEKIILKSFPSALQEKFDKIIPYLKIEDEVASKNADPNGNEPNNNKSLIPIIEKFESDGLSNKQIYAELQNEVEGVHYVIGNDGTIFFQINGVEFTESKELLIYRYMDVEVLKVKVEDNHLIFNDIEYILDEL